MEGGFWSLYGYISSFYGYFEQVYLIFHSCWARLGAAHIRVPKVPSISVGLRGKPSKQSCGNLREKYVFQKVSFLIMKKTIFREITIITVSYKYHGSYLQKAKVDSGLVEYLVLCKRTKVDAHARVDLLLPFSRVCPFLYSCTVGKLPILMGYIIGYI